MHCAVWNREAPSPKVGDSAAAAQLTQIMPNRLAASSVLRLYHSGVDLVGSRQQYGKPLRSTESTDTSERPKIDQRYLGTAGRSSRPCCTEKKLSRSLARIDPRASRASGERVATGLVVGRPRDGRMGGRETFESRPHAMMRARLAQQDREIAQVGGIQPVRGAILYARI